MAKKAKTTGKTAKTRSLSPRASKARTVVGGRPGPAPTAGWDIKQNKKTG
jgi:hypothetical protein